MKNKAPAQVQITAEQLLREAWERQESGPSAAPRQQIADTEELLEYQRSERKMYESKIMRNRMHLPLWMRYAKWEEAQGQFERARSIWERSIDTDYRAPVLWLGYAEMEMRHKFVNHARNVWDRAVALLPRVDQLWLKYAYMEEMLGKVDLARLVFQRWLKWRPEPSAYMAFVRFELRHAEVSNARAVYELLVRAHPSSHSYIKFARFEENRDEFARARNVYERASDELQPELITAGFFQCFAKFEERRGQVARARAIYSYAIDKLPKDTTTDLYRAYTVFEKQQGERQGLESILLSKKRREYDDALVANPYDYDVWFDLLRLEESAGDHARTREMYERAVGHKPIADTKRSWCRYIYLWINYALWEELTMNDLSRASQVYKACLSCIPENHKKFSFGKIWMLAAKLELRRKDVAAARRILGRALGVLPHKHSLYRGYIAIEIALAEVDRARILYRNWLERNPTCSVVFLECADMEASLGEKERARKILEIGIAMPEVDVPEALWKAIIDLEIGNGETERATALYERFLEKTDELSAWLSYGRFLGSYGSSSDTRKLYKRAHRCLKNRLMDQPNGRTVRSDLASLLEAWLTWEKSVEDAESISAVERLMPQRIKRKRAVVDDHGMEAGWEEYLEYVFPEERAAEPQLKLMDAARMWAQAQVQGSRGEDAS